MSDMSSMDLPAFFARYDRNVRRLMAVSSCITLLLSAVIATRLVTAPPPRLKGIWVTGVFFPPVVALGWWLFTEFMARSNHRTQTLRGDLPVNADDARNGIRIANAGFAFTIVLMAVVITQQILMASMAFSVPVGAFAGLSVMSVTTIAVGAVTIYLGNLWPRMPTPRTPERKAAAKMKANRGAGWFMVIVGTLVVLLGLFLPYIAPVIRPPPPPFEASKHKEISLPQDELDKFVGRYDFGNDFLISVTHDGPMLRVFREHSPGAQPAPIYPEAPHAFFWKAVEAQIRFTVDASGTVTGAEFRQGEDWQPGKRQ